MSTAEYCVVGILIVVGAALIAFALSPLSDE